MVGSLKVRSRLEAKVIRQLIKQQVPFEYEKVRVPYTKEHTYTPDLELPNGILVEVKGYWESSDRAKHLLVRDQHPDLDIRFVFQRAETKLSGKSRTTYAQWCDKHGFKWATGGEIPQSWIKEKKK